jgi:hypothetical protein
MTLWRVAAILTIAGFVVAFGRIAVERPREPDSLVPLCQSFARWKQLAHDDVPALTARCNQ